MSQQPMIKPSQIDNLPFLDASQKQQYKNGLTNLWNILESSPPGSDQYRSADEKIKKASLGLMQKMSQSQRPRPSSGGGPPSRPNQPQGNATLGQVAQQGNMAQAQAQAQPGQTTQGGGQPSGERPQQPQQTPQQQQQQQQHQQIAARAQQTMKDVVIYPPPNVSSANAEQYKSNTRRSWLNCLIVHDQLIPAGRRLQNSITTLTQSGQPIPQTMQAQFQEIKIKIENNNKTLNALKARNAEYMNATSLNNQSQGQQVNGTSRGGAQQTPNAVSPQQADSKPIGLEQPPANSPAQPPGGFPSQHQAGQNQQGSTAVQPAQAPTPMQSQQQTPQTATQPQPPRNFPSNNMAQTPHQQPQRPSINAQQAQAHMAQHQAQGTPTSALPQNVRPGQQPDHPTLTQSAAISQANNEYARTQSQQGPPPGQATQPMPNGMQYNQQHPGARQGTPSSYSSMQPTQTSSANSKFPIPKTLSLEPRTQNAAPGPPSRPTLANQGMMSQPGIQRPPTYTLEGEGDRVLSKRKLDELVRQVTGSAPDSSGESASVLAPDVEESMMQVADNFVDEVITAACRLAKLRPTQTLDIRDIQIVLERNYGIRIPGYSLDEVRTVRKFQPAPGWHSKMQAVQAGKVMGNRDS